MRPVLLACLACAAAPHGAAPHEFSAAQIESCAEICKGLGCETPHECADAQTLFGCECDACAACAGRRLYDSADSANSTNSTSSVCLKPCLGASGGCDAFVPLGATCVDLETNEYLRMGGETCDCSGCQTCDVTDDFPAAVDGCAAGGSTVDVRTEAELTAALEKRETCLIITLDNDILLNAGAFIETSVQLIGAALRPVLSPAPGPPHRLVAVVDQAVASLTSLALRGGFDAFAGGCVFVAGGAELSLDRVLLEDCAAGYNGGGVAAWTGATLFMEASFIHNCAAAVSGGGVYGHTRSSVVLSATTVSRCSARTGGGVQISTDATLEISQSQIQDCVSANGGGGGTFVGRRGTMILKTGSVVSNSHSDLSGGGLFAYVYASIKFESGSSFTNCTSAFVGGAAHVFVTAVLYASDCSFRGCITQTGPAGGVFVMSALFQRVEFTDCNAGSGGGGGALALGAESSATLADSSFLRCYASATGGAILAWNPLGPLRIMRTSVKDCSSDGDGGGLRVGTGCRASVEASVFSDNAAAGDGGAISVGAASSLAIFGGSRLERNAAKSGGGLALLPAATAGVADSMISDNVALSCGGGASVGAGATLHLGRGAVFSGNVAWQDGGAVDVRGTAAKLYVSATCSFVQITLDWTPASTVDAADASVFFDGRTFHPMSGAVSTFAVCSKPGKYELWVASLYAESWRQASWALTLPPRYGAAAVEGRLTFVQAVNEDGALGAPVQTYGLLAAAFDLDGAAFDLDAAENDDAGAMNAVHILKNVALAGDGGGLSATEAGRIVVHEALLQGNTAKGDGGALNVGAQSKAELGKSRVENNDAGKNGGGLAVGLLGVVDVYDSSASTNSAGGRGGFAALDRARSATFTSLTAVGNRADRGGALALALCDQQTIVLAQSVLQNNSAKAFGGGVDVHESFLRIEGACLFSGNWVDAGSGGGIAIRPDGASLTLAPMPEDCLGVLSVVVDWRGANCSFRGPTLGDTCDTLLSYCGQFRSVEGPGSCDGCACKDLEVGAGESYFQVSRDGEAVFLGEPDAGASKVFEVCLAAGDYQVVAFDRRGAKWFGGTMSAALVGAEYEKGVWSSTGLETEPLRLSVAGGHDGNVRFVDNEVLKGGGAAVYWALQEPVGLPDCEPHSFGNKAAYGAFAATPATRLLVNTSFAYAVPHAAMPAMHVVMVDWHGNVVRADSTTAVSAQFRDAKVQASGLVAVCSEGVATFDSITITGSPGDVHSLRFFAPTSDLETSSITVELVQCPVGFVERGDDFGVSCIACLYTEYFSNGRCLKCPRGANCLRAPPLDDSSKKVGYQLYTVETLPIRQGFYRFYSDSDDIYPCADKDYSKGSTTSCAGVGYAEAFSNPWKTHGSALCAKNSRGPLCALCASGYYPRPSSLDKGGGCAKCGGSSTLPIFFATVLTSLLALFIVGSAFAVSSAGVQKTKRRVFKAAAFARSRWFLVAVVQVWYAISTVSRFVAIEHVRYPQPLHMVLQYLGFLCFDLAFVLPSLQCYYDMSYFEVFLAWSLFPLAFGAFLLIGVFAVASYRVGRPFQVWQYVSSTSAGRASRRTATSLFLLVVVIQHNYICSIILTFYSCSQRFAVSDTQTETWLAYDFKVRCGSDAYHEFKGAAATLLLLYVVVVPLGLALKLKWNRLNNRSDGALSFFTRHVRPAVWYYEILALEVRLVVCGALVPFTGRGLRICILLVFIFAWTTVTRELRPYINRGHMALVNFLQFFVLSCIALALVMKGQFLTDKAEKALSFVVSAITLAITARLYSAFRTEEVSEVLELIRTRRPFDRHAFLRLHVGMNVRLLDDAVFAAALDVLDDEFRQTRGKAGGKAAGKAKDNSERGWSYLTTQLLPLQSVWTRAVPMRMLLATHAPRMLANAALLARTRLRCSPEGCRVTFEKFEKDVHVVLGPLARDVRGDDVAEVFERFAEPAMQTLDVGAKFQPALKAVVDLLARDGALEDDEDGLEAVSAVRRRSFSGSLRSSGSSCASFSGGARASKASLHDVAVAVVELTTKDDVESLEARPPLFQLLRRRLTGHACRTFEATRRHSDEATTDEATGWSGSKEAFFDLAVYAHCANFKCWMVMEDAAAELLGEEEWGRRLCDLVDFSEGAPLQAPLQDEHLQAWAARLGGEALRGHFDEAVLPHALRAVALDAHPAFVEALRTLVCNGNDEGKSPEKPLGWASKCELYKIGPTTAVKSAKRMSVKVHEYRESDVHDYSEQSEDSPEWPCAARISDPLRATIVCDGAEAVVKAYAAIRDGSGAFRVTRLKNKLALCTKPFNLHINAVFDRGDGTAPLTVEIQIVPRAVNAVSGPSHNFYTLSRAPTAAALVE